MNNIFESIEPVISKHLNNKISKARINQILNESKLYHSLLEKYGIRAYDLIDYKAQEDPDFEKLRENHRFIKIF